MELSYVRQCGDFLRRRCSMKATCLQQGQPKLLYRIISLIDAVLQMRTRSHRGQYKKLLHIEVSATTFLWVAVLNMKPPHVHIFRREFIHKGTMV